jgi:hypothetical protein
MCGRYYSLFDKQQVAEHSHAQLERSVSESAIWRRVIG